jgi:hypothetical protein
MLNQKACIVVLTFALAIASLSACPNETGCRECGTDAQNNPICTYCDFGYLDPQTKACQNNVKEKVTNCLSYRMVNGAVQCRKCDSGFIVDINGNCQPCHSKDCAICNDNDECLACKNSIVLTNKSCDSNIKCKDTNCAICSETLDSSHCHACNPTFMRNELGVCVPAFENCEIGNSSSKTCVLCVTGYYVTNDGKCLNYVSGGIGLIWWLFIIALLSAVGYFAYYFLVLKKKEQESSSDAEYVSLNK